MNIKLSVATGCLIVLTACSSLPLQHNMTWSDVSFNDLDPEELVFVGEEYIVTFVVNQEEVYGDYVNIIGKFVGGNFEDKFIVATALRYDFQIDHIYKARGTLIPDSQTGKRFLLFEVEDLGTYEGITFEELPGGITPTPTRDPRLMSV